MSRIRSITIMRPLSVLMVFASVSSALCSEPVTIVFKSGRRAMAQLDPRTNEQRLWLVFGNERIRVTRGVPWSDVASVLNGTETLSVETVRGMAQAAATAGVAEDPSREQVTGRARVLDVPSREFGVRDELPDSNVSQSALSRVRSVRFDAMLANWDADVETDGLLIRPQALSATGEAVAVSGTLSAELWSMRRVDQDAVSGSAGRSFELVGQWSIPIDRAGQDPAGEWIQLPFQANHPEIDMKWAPYGLVHVQFAVPGQGVFHHTEDGLRIRPYAPLRDSRERATGDRFFPGENRGRT